MAVVQTEQAGANREVHLVDSILTNFYALYSANFDNAIRLMEVAQQLSLKNGWQEKEANALMYFGIAHSLRGNYEKALKSYFSASEIFQKISDFNGIARLYNEISVIYRHQGHMQRAYAALDKAEAAALAANNLEQLGTNYGMRGNILSKKGDIDSAQVYFQKVMDIRVELSDSVGLGYVLLDFANYHFAKGNLEMSDLYIKQSTDIRVKLDDIQGVAENEHLIGKNFFSLQQYSTAIDHFLKSNELANRAGYPWLIRQNYDWLQLCYAKLKNYEAAYFNELKYREFNDSLFNINKTTAIEELQTKYETEKKDQQITLLDQENKLQQATNQRNRSIITTLFIGVLLLILVFYLWRVRISIRQQEVLNEQKMRLREAQIHAVINSEEKERKRFASDLHDSMGQLVSALTMNIQGLKDASNDKMVRSEIVDNSTTLLNDIQHEIRNIAFNLMPLVLSNEGLIPALQELSARINKSNRVKADVQSFGLKERFNEVFEISLYRILQEWISNVLKYAAATEILIQFTEHDNEVIITVEDNGEGFELQSFEHGKGNGWRNINTRLNLIHGTMDIDSQKGRKNTTLTLTIDKIQAYKPVPVALNT
ncbi:MAG: sensor histidine kinase [Fulvivirga sp.]|uniref:tetratricopeptide repeat-containing sensor histidine kinase n=2 Tax=Fulvivirga sp. TaxID=1931237 RepID=UPI0032EEA8A7